MEEELEGGQFLDEATTGAAEGKAGKPPRPARCKRYARARFAEALPMIMKKLLYEVEQGSVPHLKVVLEFDSAAVLFAQACGVLVDEVQLEIVSLRERRRLA